MDTSLFFKKTVTSDQCDIFMPSWLSTTGIIFIAFLPIAVGTTWLTVIAIIAIGKSSVLAYFFGAFLVVVVVLMWQMGRQLLGTAPLLCFGPAGVSARVLKDQTIAWNDIANITLDTVRRAGISRLTLNLVPQQGQQNMSSFFTGTNSVQRVIPLGALRAADIPRVLNAAQAAYVRYTNTHMVHAGE